MALPSEIWGIASNTSIRDNEWIKRHRFAMNGTVIFYDPSYRY